MANGDVASAAGIFTPVASGADFRQGYDDINRLADALAKDTRSSWTQYATSAAAVAAGFTTQPNYTINSVSVSVLGKHVSLVVITTRATTALAASPSGDIPNEKLIGIPPSITPQVSNGPGNGGGTGGVRQGYAGSDGFLWLGAVTPGYGLNIGDSVSMHITYHL